MLSSDICGGDTGRKESFTQLRNGEEKMEIKVDIDERTLSLIKSHSDKDVSSIICEALLKWASENILACPLDHTFCSCKEPCNNCQKAKNML